jgi:hypothetical protein
VLASPTKTLGRRYSKPICIFPYATWRTRVPEAQGNVLGMFQFGPSVGHAAREDTREAHRSYNRNVMEDARAELQRGNAAHCGQNYVRDWRWNSLLSTGVMTQRRRAGERERISDTSGSGAGELKEGKRDTK